GASPPRALRGCRGRPPGGEARASSPGLRPFGVERRPPPRDGPPRFGTGDRRMNGLSPWKETSVSLGCGVLLVRPTPGPERDRAGRHVPRVSGVNSLTPTREEATDGRDAMAGGSIRGAPRTAARGGLPDARLGQRGRRCGAGGLAATRPLRRRRDRQPGRLAHD